MTDNDEIIGLIYRAVDSINLDSDQDHQVTKSPSTRLYGKHSILDSLGLVSLIIAIEQELDDELGLTVTLANERALSMKNSPFKTIQTMADYIRELIKEGEND